MKYLFILNPRSGKKHKQAYIVKLIEQIFKKTNHQYHFVFTTRPEEATELAREGVNRSYDIITAVGGDGTVHEVARGLIQQNSILGIIPLGSGNGLARSLDISLKLDQSIHFLTNPRVTSIDIGKVNQYYFFGVCGIGLDAQIAKKFQEYGKRGPLPYFIIGIKEYLSYNPDSYIIKNENFESEIKPLLITIANTKQYGNGAVIAPQADFQDGILDICILYKMPLIKAVRYIPKLFNGTINTVPYYETFKTKSLQIILSQEKGIIHTDGEPAIIDNPINIKILNRALKVCVPGAG
jgi:diacylglycerol kinase (ATP)